MSQYHLPVNKVDGHAKNEVLFPIGDVEQFIVRQLLLIIQSLRIVMAASVVVNVPAFVIYGNKPKVIGMVRAA